MKVIKGKKKVMCLKFLVTTIHQHCEIYSWTGEKIVTKYNFASSCICKDISLGGCTIYRIHTATAGKGRRRVAELHSFLKIVAQLIVRQYDKFYRILIPRKKIMKENILVYFAQQNKTNWTLSVHYLCTLEIAQCDHNWIE